MAAEDGIKAPPAIQEKLRKLGLTRRDDLVLHLPLRYEDETSITLIGEAMPGVPVQVDAEVLDVSVQFRPRRQLVATVADASGELTLRFLNFYGSQTKQLEKARDDGRRLRIFGEIRHGFLGAEMVHPRYRVVSEDDTLPQSLTPVYPSTAGITRALPSSVPVTKKCQGWELTEDGDRRRTSMRSAMSRSLILRAGS